MLYNSLVASALLLASGASAQYGSDPMAGSGAMTESSSMAGEAATTSAASAPMATTAGEGQVMVQVVQVGGSNGSLEYYPNNVQAPVGSMVQFQFHPKNHTVTQSAFDSPCVPMSSTNASAPMIKSGFMPVSQSDSMLPLMTVMINDTKPIWLFCGQTGHCQKGMVMVINEQPSSGKTLEAYKAKAAQASSGSSSSGSGSAGASGSGGSATSSSGPAQQSTSGAAQLPVVGFTSLVGFLALGCAFLL
ncbi:MAG: hypothetical protein Q9227_000594 [Pyrenula ochraceoflavens]